MSQEPMTPRPTVTEPASSPGTGWRTAQDGWSPGSQAGPAPPAEGVRPPRLVVLARATAWGTRRKAEPAATTLCAAALRALVTGGGEASMAVRRAPERPRAGCWAAGEGLARGAHGTHAAKGILGGPGSGRFSAQVRATARGEGAGINPGALGRPS